MSAPHRREAETNERYVLVDGPGHVVDEDAPIRMHYRATFSGPGGETIERYMTDGGRATLLDAIDRGKREFTSAELHEMSVPPDMDALLTRYDEEAGVGG
jgi:hypothetical protein